MQKKSTQGERVRTRAHPASSRLPEPLGHASFADKITIPLTLTDLKSELDQFGLRKIKKSRTKKSLKAKECSKTFCNKKTCMFIILASNAM